MSYGTLYVHCIVPENVQTSPVKGILVYTLPSIPLEIPVSAHTIASVKYVGF